MSFPSTWGTSSPVANWSDLQTKISTIVDPQPTNWDVRVTQTRVVVARQGTLSPEGGHVLLVPRTPDLINSTSLLALWSFVWASKANLSFDSEIGFAYGRITIIGDADLQNAISDKLQKDLHTEGRQVERISCRTANELASILNARREKNEFFPTK